MKINQILLFRLLHKASLEAQKVIQDAEMSEIKESNLQSQPN